MLARLLIENVAVIEHCEIEFSAGFNVLTGETGAGKSILIDAIGAVLGERTSRELIRTGESRALVCAEFEDVSDSVSQIAADLGYEVEDGMLILRREIREDGKSVCRINGQGATVSMLREIGRALINIHGQHENTALLSVDRHLGYIDSVAENKNLRDEYLAAYRQLRSLEKELRSLDTDDEMRERRMELLRFQIEEIEDAAILPGEYEELVARRTTYRNFERISRALAAAYELLSGGEDEYGAFDILSQSADKLESVSQLFEGAEQIAERLRSLSYEAEDATGQLRSLRSNLEFDEDDLDEVENRLAVLEKIRRKYGDEKAAIDTLESAKKELATYEHSDERREELRSLIAAARSAAEETAGRLSENRRENAESFCARVCEETVFLDMPNIRFTFAQSKTELSETGADAFEFLLSANVGEPARPLAKIASGGELSRIMLAVKNVLADKDDIDSLIFDEVDTGISGRAANKVGIKLREVSRGRQIICVTHLAQIAALAHTHLFISKQVINDRTSTSVRALDEQERVGEIARIIGGDSRTDALLETAREMIAAAGNDDN